MSFKPFKPPGIRSTTTQIENESSEPQSKRRKLSPEASTVSVKSQRVPILPSSPPSRTPLQQVRNASHSEQPASARSCSDAVYFTVLWRKFTQKKNKTWDDDGYMCLQAGQASIFDSRGKRLGQSSFVKEPESGLIIPIAGKDVEIGDKISKAAFLKAMGEDNVTKRSNEVREREPVSSKQSAVPPSKPMSMKEKMRMQIASAKPADSAGIQRSTLVTGQRTAFKQPLKENTVLAQVPSETPIPRHNPDAPGALLFKRPKKAPAGRQLVDVVLDPALGKHLRAHQREGVKFLYECVMDLRDFGGRGCILADDMGLGKTLQTIALLWTLTKQNPVYKAEPVIKKALIVCPATLIQNWKKEFRKWLGADKLGVMTFEDKGSRLSMFDGRNFKVMIVGYERLRNIAEDLVKGAGIDIVICDEGHRLKTLQNKSAKAIESLNTSKRIILSGTPIQNDLSEFFAMVNFVNDGCLGSSKGFLKDFEKPIMRSRQPNATEDDIENGEAASAELARTTSPFILRRTADILSKYLPPRTEYVLFCNPTPEQANIYRQVLKSPMFQNALGSSETALQLITILKKLCNSPALMRPDRGSDESTSSSSLTTLNEMLPAGISRYYHNSYASKIRLLDELLQNIRTTTTDKVILVSNYTSTLNLMAQLLDSTGGQYLRLDGSVPQGKRQGLVDQFNRTPASTCFAFLLSAKAGGVGLNLIGANRLVLFDVDWNPATDDQAMARIHREGQKKHCKIYRFLIKGGLEERIWQRQVVKRALADSIMEGGGSNSATMDLGSKSKGKAAFSREELKDLFRLDEQEGSRTHDLIGCSCAGTGEMQGELRSGVTSDDEDNINALSSDVDEDDLPSVADIVPASRLTDRDLEDQERRIATGRHPKQAHAKNTEKQEKQELMRFVHLDTAKVPELSNKNDVEELASVETIVDDSCLMHVLKQDNEIITGRITYLFKKTTGPKVDE